MVERTVLAVLGTDLVRRCVDRFRASLTTVLRLLWPMGLTLAETSVLVSTSCSGTRQWVAATQWNRLRRTSVVLKISIDPKPFPRLMGVGQGRRQAALQERTMRQFHLKSRPGLYFDS